MPKLETYSPSCNKDYFQKFFSEKYGISHLEEDYFRYIDYDSVFVFSREEWDEFLSIVEKENAVFIKAYDVSQQEIEQNLPEFGPLLKYFPRHFSVKDFFLARYDVIIDSKDGNYKFLETNSNTPGLITESYHLAKHLCPSELYNPADSFVQHIQSVFSPFREKKLGILLSHSFDDEDFIMANDYKDMLSDIFGAENIVISDIYESHII